MMYKRKYYVYTPGGSNQPFRMNCILGLIIINVLAFILVPEMLWWELALNSDGIRQFKLWQPVTYLFLHGGVIHILFNMYGLYLFGNHVLARLGAKRFLMLYFLSGISGAVLWLVFNWGSQASVIGASGAVFGVIMAAAIFYPDMRIMLIVPPVQMTLKTLVAIFAVIGILSELSSSQGGIAHLAHLGGFLFAYVYIRMLEGHTLADIVKSPFRWSHSSGSHGQQSRIFPPKQSEINRKTFEEIMAEIEEIERAEKRKQDDDSMKQ